MVDSVKRFATVRINNILLSIHPPSQSAEDYLDGQTWSSLQESMLTTPSHLLILHTFGNDTWKDLLHHLPRDQWKADWSVIPCIFLLALEKSRTSTFFQSSVTSFNCCAPSVMIETGLVITLASPQHLWLHVSGPIDFCASSWFKCSLTSSSSIKGKSYLWRTSEWMREDLCMSADSYYKLAWIDIRLLCLKKLWKPDISRNHIKWLQATADDLIYPQELNVHSSHLESVSIAFCNSTLQTVLGPQPNQN